ncbi:MAG TPA: DNA-directed RNA polymerase subunit omega [Candidatus Wallbacteria bacterium]|nr:MAG: DNA-directed RNA polymerase subunit omega [bacterium ADurb.Bin243]HOD39111.1 DNA-directed RNA polymerase subunit omega [Candidatus Wallbacteria bacterium]HPG60186.1 DNA-directed RNA polymerase subunit omega [Candidatus Wallbacteria bacterium]
MNPRSFDDLSKIIPNKFLLTMVIAARAKQLEKGAEKKVECAYTNSIDIAIEELYHQKLDIKMILDGFEENLKKEAVLNLEIQSRTLDNAFNSSNHGGNADQEGE